MARAKRLFSRRVEIFLEFLVFGVAVGIIEDLLAIGLATEATITWEVVGIAFLVAVPFAFLGEVIVDRKHLIPVLSSLNNLANLPKTKRPKK